VFEFVLNERTAVTFIQVDDPWSPDGEQILQNDKPGSAPDKQNDLLRQGDELEPQSRIPLTPSIETNLGTGEASSYLHHEIELEADMGVEGEPPGETPQNIPSQSSPGWNTPNSNLTADTPASVGFSAQRTGRSRRNADPKVVVSHMLRNFKEGPGQW
jgi:hypothetical protein